MIRSALFATLAVCLLACGGEDAGSQPAMPDKPEPSEPAPAEPVAEAPKPAACTVPEGNLLGDADAGKSQYGVYCATCHGAKGKGDGPAAPADPKPADHSDPAYMNALTDAHLYKVIACGGPAVDKSPLMAKWGGILNEQQIKDLIAYVRTLSAS